ncbi:MAG: hypothetical protein AAF662_14015, partial [Pseudomonadota bacterium]
GVSSAAAGGGSSLAYVLLGGAAIAGGEAAASSSDDDDSDSEGSTGGGSGGTGGGGGGGTGSGGGTGTGGGAGSGGGSGAITDFAGRSEGPNVCGDSGNAAFRWVVDLTQSGTDVNGVITFHNCPGGGRAEYEVTGTATDGSSLELQGSLTFSIGPLASTAPSNQVFVVSPGSAPNPNFAP